MTTIFRIAGVAFALTVALSSVARGSDPVPDPNDEKMAVVNVKPVKKLKNPVTLAAIKADEDFASWELVRNSRLSVMPVSDAIWKKIVAMSEG